jgi:hypothetical protein
VDFNFQLQGSILISDLPQAARMLVMFEDHADNPVVGWACCPVYKFDQVIDMCVHEVMLFLIHIFGCSCFRRCKLAFSQFHCGPWRTSVSDPLVNSRALHTTHSSSVRLPSSLCSFLLYAAGERNPTTAATTVQNTDTSAATLVLHFNNFPRPVR